MDNLKTIETIDEAIAKLNEVGHAKYDRWERGVNDAGAVGASAIDHFIHAEDAILIARYYSTREAIISHSLATGY